MMLTSLLPSTSKQVQKQHRTDFHHAGVLPEEPRLQRQNNNKVCLAEAA
jgi:hypothetical protein